MDNSENVKNCQHCSNCCNSDTETYLEIYKLQIDTITKISDRRVNVNRYYIFAISALILALSVVSSSEFLEIITPKSSESSEGSEESKNKSEDSKGLTFFMGVSGGLGSILTLSWILNMLGYLISNTKRYEKIKNLECHLPYRFTESMWQSTSNGNTKKYFNFAAHELLTPFVFCIGFTMLSLYGFCKFFLVASKYQSYILLIGVLGIFILFSIMYVRGKTNVEK